MEAEDRFVLSAVTVHGQTWLSKHSVLAYLHLVAEQYDALGHPESAKALRDAAKNIRLATRA